MRTFPALPVLVAAGAIAVGTLGFPAVAAAEPNLAPAMVTTTCSLDQILAATRVEDPVTYGALVGRFNASPRWVQGGIVYHMNTLLQTAPPQRQAVANQLAGRFPDFVNLFTVAEPAANKIAATCPTFPAEDPAIWNPAAPAPSPVAAPAPPAPPAPQPATAVAPPA